MCCRHAKSSRWLKLANNSDPIAPTEAASVGVARPAIIEPSTAIINAIGGSSARIHRLNNSPTGRLVCMAGIASGRLAAMKNIYSR